MSFYSRVSYSGDGVQDTFTVPFPYLDKTHVKVLINGVPVVFSWDSATVVRTSIVPAADSVVTVKRETPRDNSLVTYQDASKLPAADLNKATLQMLYVLQEVMDSYQLALGNVVLDENGDPVSSLTYNEVVQGMVDDVVNSELYNFLGERIGQIDDLTVTIDGHEVRVTDLEGNYTVLNDLVEQAGETSLQTLLLQQNVFDDNRSNLALIQNEQIVRADADSTLASDITTVQTQVDDHEATIQTQATSIDGLEAQYTVKIQVGTQGELHVAGFGLAVYENDDMETTSDFIVRADRFAVAAPSGDDNLTRVPFIIDSQTGQVAIDGNLMVTGSVTADKMNVNELSAISGNLGTVIGGLFATGVDPNYRVEMTSLDGFPLWYGNGAKTWENAKFVVDTLGNVKFNGHLEAATGTFSGDLNAAGGTFTGTLQGVDGDFSGTLAANTVITDNLVANAVSVTSSVFRGDTINPQGFTVDDVSLVVDTEGAPTLILLTAFVGTRSDTTSSYSVKARFYIDGNYVEDSQVWLVGIDDSSTSMLIRVSGATSNVEYPLAGPHTFSVRFTGHPTSSWIYDRTLTVIGLKR